MNSDIRLGLILLGITILLWLIFRRKNKPVRVGDPNKPTEILLERQRAQVCDGEQNGKTAPHGPILSKPAHVQVPDNARADSEAERKRRRDESSGGDSFVVVNSAAYSGGKTAKAADTDSGGTSTKDTGSIGDTGGSSGSDGGGGGGCGD